MVNEDRLNEIEDKLAGDAEHARGAGWYDDIRHLIAAVRALEEENHELRVTIVSKINSDYDWAMEMDKALLPDDYEGPR